MLAMLACWQAPGTDSKHEGFGEWKLHIPEMERKMGPSTVGPMPGQGGPPTLYYLNVGVNQLLTCLDLLVGINLKLIQGPRM